MLDICHIGRNNHNIVRSNHYDGEHNRAPDLNSYARMNSCVDLNNSAGFYAENADDAFDKLFVHDESLHMHLNGVCCTHADFCSDVSVYERLFDCDLIEKYCELCHVCAQLDADYRI